MDKMSKYTSIINKMFFFSQSVEDYKYI